MTLRKTFLKLNGVERMIVCDPEKDTLADVIRRLGLTGTKVGCGAGQCGACSVILDDVVTRSCTKKMKSVRDYAEILTIEGIGTPTNLHALQVAWITCGGVQCGFCSPGFIVSAKALLDRNQNPTREEVRDWFMKNRNACRCTGYKPLVDCVMKAAKVIRGELTLEDIQFKVPEGGRIYGTRYPRPAALAKVTGTCDFGDDINMKAPDGTLHLAVVQTKVNHANILSIDITAAEAIPGVIKVITAKDVKGTNRITFPSSSPRCLSDGRERPIIADQKIVRRGDVCAIVAATDRRTAREAAALVKVELEPLPEYMNALEAIAEDAMEIHEGVPNLYYRLPVFKGGDTQEALEKSKYIVEGSYYLQRQPHLVIEPDTMLSYYDEDGKLTIQCKTLGVNVPRGTLAMGLGITPADMRVIENPTGASFGYSVSPCHAALMGAATMATGKACALTMSYEEHNHFSGKRAPAFTNLTMGADENGKLTAMEFEIAYEKGAYTELADLINKGIRFMGAPYTIPNVMGMTKAIMTNHNFTTAFRGYGAPQAFAASEQGMDELAEKAGIDPLEFRYINVYRSGETTINGNTLPVYPMAELIDRIRPQYQAAIKRAESESTPEKLRGVGVACGTYNVTGGINDHSEMALELNPDGTVTHFNSWEDQGQGGDIGTLVHTHEALRPLGLRPDQIKLVQNDTAITPISGSASASRSHYMVGNATINAAKQLLDAMRKADGSYRTYDEMVAEEIPTKYLGVFDTTGMGTDLDVNTGQGNPTPEYTYGVFLSEVEVDAATGKTKVLSMSLEGDVGVIGSWQAIEGQAYGGLAQAIGLALSENYEDVKKDINLIQCGFPFIADVPDNLNISHIETPRPTGPNGSSGAAEMYLTSAHIAVINAIYNATGVRIRELPATADKVLAGLKKKAEGKDPNICKPYDLGDDFRERMQWMKDNPIIKDAPVQAAVKKEMKSEQSEKIELESM